MLWQHDEVKYKWLKSELYEIRKYSDRLVIETKNNRSNQNKAVLENYLNYISGDNKEKKK